MDQFRNSKFPHLLIETLVSLYETMNGRDRLSPLYMMYNKLNNPSNRIPQMVQTGIVTGLSMTKTPNECNL